MVPDAGAHTAGCWRRVLADVLTFAGGALARA